MPKVSEEHRAVRRDQIVRATWRCVARTGFHKTSMADVIEESGLSAGAVYRYFESKDQILQEIAQRSIGSVEDLFQRFLADGAAPHPADVLEALLDRFVELANAEDGDFTLIAVQAWGEAVRGGEIYDVVRPKLHAARELWTEVVRRYQSAGHLDAAAEPEAVGRTLMGLIPGFMLQRLMFGDVTAKTYAAGLRALIDS